MTQRKTFTQKAFTEAVTKYVDAGETLESATAKACAELNLGSTPNALVVRQELGLDDEALRQHVGARIAKRYLDADEDKWPKFITDLELVDPVACAKLKLEYLKTHKGDLATAFITKTERRILETDETRGRSDEEIEFRLAHGKWPDEMVIDGDPTGTVN